MKTHDLSSHDPTRQHEADARELDDYAHGQDPAEAQAALWATRRFEGLDAVTEAEFQTWLAADPSHSEAYAQMERSFDHLRGLPAPHVDSLKASLAPARPSRMPSRHPTRVSERRAWIHDLTRLFPPMATVALVLSMVGGWLGWDHWRNQPTFAQSYSTARGQPLDIDLPDGSTLQLDVATQAEVRLYRHRREVRLQDGQAMFIVHHDPEHPFDVLAGMSRVTVVGTRFSVRRTQAGLDAGKTVVAVESGRVRVSPIDSTQAANMPENRRLVELGTGQGVSVNGAGWLEPVVGLAPEGVAVWRKGRVSFNDTPLAQALLELERYGPTGLVVRDPAVGALRLGGSFDLRQTGAFAKALPHLLPVRLKQQGSLTEIVAAP